MKADEAAYIRGARKQAGSATNKLIFSSQSGTNTAVFTQILDMFVAKGASVADVTFGRGAFWKAVDRPDITLLATDKYSLETSTDCRDLPYEDGSVDVVVLDPPYMHTPGQGAHVGHQNFETFYRNNTIDDDPEDAEPAVRPAKYHEAVLSLYYAAGKEAARVLKQGGFFIVKCQDEVCSNRQRLTHVELVNEFEGYGFITEDLFVVTRNGKPGVSRLLGRQRHARKNHSYFLIFWKADKIRRWAGLPK